MTIPPNIGSFFSPWRKSPRLYCLVHPSIWHTWPSGEWPWMNAHLDVDAFGRVALETLRKKAWHCRGVFIFCCLTYYDLLCRWMMVASFLKMNSDFSMVFFWFHPVAMKGYGFENQDPLLNCGQLWSAQIYPKIWAICWWVATATKVNGGSFAESLGVIVGGFVASLRSWANLIFYGLGSS